MKIELDSDQIFDILNEWCKKEHGWNINFAVWLVEDDRKFGGIVIKYGPA